jgi:hypothetical protein
VPNQRASYVSWRMVQKSLAKRCDVMYA